LYPFPSALKVETFISKKRIKTRFKGFEINNEMNGLLPFLYLSNRAPCPQDIVKISCGCTISVKSHRQIYTGPAVPPASESWGELNTGIGCVGINRAAMN
jgi:hypothetical protein